MLKIFWALALFILYNMFSFPADTELKISQLDAVFSLRVRAFFLLVKVFLGLDMVIVSGRRSASQQLALHLADHRNPAPVPGKPDSHMRGLAVDINGYKDGKIVLLKNSPLADWQPVVSLANLCGLRWGGIFKDYYDGNHFDGI